MTVFDLLFIVLFLAVCVTIIIAASLLFRGRRTQALAIFGRLAVCFATYIAIVYVVTAFSKQTVLKVDDPECSDDWCLAVDSVTKRPSAAVIHYDVSLRIFSRARRVAQRELVAKDVYLMDGNGRRYDPVLTGSEVPPNTLLQPGESALRPHAGSNFRPARMTSAS